MTVLSMSALALGAALLTASAGAKTGAAPAEPKSAVAAAEPKAAVAAAEPKAAIAAAEPKDAVAAAEPKMPKIKGTIKVEGKPTLAELKKKVKVTQADAEKAALKAVGGEGSKRTTYAELEIEQGYLVYAIDVKVEGKQGVEEVWVDAGSGKVLGRRHEIDDDDEEFEDDEDDEADEGE